jgi:hypothetical protein
LNNTVEQDHRFIKISTKQMMEFKAFHSASGNLTKYKGINPLVAIQMALNGNIDADGGERLQSDETSLMRIPVPLPVSKQMKPLKTLIGW